MKYILASTSKRRHELLSEIIKGFIIKNPSVDENIPFESPDDLVLNLSKLKANAILDKNEDDVIIAADTVVVFKNEILGKPKNYSDAFITLKKLSGNIHYVYTGVSIKKNNEIKSFVEKTKIKFRDLTDEEIKYYIENKKPYDKAGSYGIQETDFVIEIEGSYTNVVGLPVKRLKKELINLNNNILEVINLVKKFDKEIILDKINFKVKRGSIFSIIGKSGIGKSTIAKIIIGILNKDEGKIIFDGDDIENRNIKDIQMIFQDPYSSLNEKMTVYDILKEPLIVNKEKNIEKRVEEMLDILLLSNYKDKYPSNLSGGQRQRVVVGAAMILKPKLIICDEPLSALDLRTQEQILDLIKYFNKEYKITFIFISHDMDIVKDISDEIFEIKR